MGNAYCQDLWVCVLAALDGGMIKMAAHHTFRISRSTIRDWLALRAAQGHVRPNAPAQRGPPPAIADVDAFTAFAHDHNGCTLAQMAHAWEQATGCRLSRNTFSLALRKIGWTRKNVRCLRRAKRRPTRRVSAAGEPDRAHTRVDVDEAGVDDTLCYPYG